MESTKHIVYSPVETYFDEFCAATILDKIIANFNSLCDALNLAFLPGDAYFHRSLRAKLSNYWKAEAFFSNLNVRVQEQNHKNQQACENIQALVIGCGPCGLRCAIELAIQGANVVVVEKRSSFSRNNVLHLWPYLISDLKSLGAKTFFGKFCAGSIDHISTRALQCILLKIALLFGVQIITGVTFERLIEPSDDESFILNGCDDAVDGENPASKLASRSLFTLFRGDRIATRGWRAEFIPLRRALSSFEFNVFVDAAGKSNSCLNFPRKELRCRLAIAITVNFINHNTPEEAHVEEISGVASIFHQEYFSRITTTLGIELENLVYYKDETHYFVMTVKKKSLLAKGILKKDLDDPARLLHSSNVDFEALEKLSRDVATFATRGTLPRLDFALNAHGKPDVAVFDFTSLSAAEYACRIIDRRGRPLLQCLVGDALMEPFWPTGSGCALGFLSALDAAWAASLFAAGHHALKVLAWRDSVYQRLSQTNVSNMPSAFSTYTLEPNTRYTFCDMGLVLPMQVRHLYDCDAIIGMADRKSFTFLRDSVKFEDASPPNQQQQQHRSRSSSTSQVGVLTWFQQRLAPYTKAGACPLVTDLHSDDDAWRSRRALRCLLHKFRPDLAPEASLWSPLTETEKSEDMRLLTEHFNIRPKDDWRDYCQSLYACLHLQKPDRPTSDLWLLRKRDVPKRSVVGVEVVARRRSSAHVPSSSSRPSEVVTRRVEIGRLRDLFANPPDRELSASSSSFFRENASKAVETGIISKRRSELISMLNDPASAKRRSILIDLERSFDETGLSSLHQRRGPTVSAGGSREDLSLFTIQTQCDNYSRRSPAKSSVVHPNMFSKRDSLRQSKDFCAVCKKRLYAAESRAFDGYRLHPKCFRCVDCQCPLRPENAHCFRGNIPSDLKFLCTTHFHELTVKRMEGNRRQAFSISSKKMFSPSDSMIKSLAHNTPSLFSGLVPSHHHHPTTSSASRRPPLDVRRPQLLPTATDQLFENRLHRHSSSRQTTRILHLGRGIRDEPAPPVLLSSASGTLGMPETERKAAFEERLFMLSGVTMSSMLPRDCFEHLPTSVTDNDLLFASNESDKETSLDISDECLWGNHPRPFTVEEMVSLCQQLRADSLYRRHHPSENEQSSSDSSYSSSCDENESNIKLGQQPPIYENARWTLNKSQSPPPSTASSALAQKYGLPMPEVPVDIISPKPLTTSILSAKQRFCMEAPKPLSIDPHAFLASRNKERATESTLTDCSEEADRLSIAHRVAATISVIDSPYTYSFAKFELCRYQRILPYIFNSPTTRVCLLATTQIADQSTLHRSTPIAVKPFESVQTSENILKISPLVQFTEPTLYCSLKAIYQPLPEQFKGEFKSVSNDIHYMNSDIDTVIRPTKKYVQDTLPVLSGGLQAYLNHNLDSEIHSNLSDVDCIPLKHQKHLSKENLRPISIDSRRALDMFREVCCSDIDTLHHKGSVNIICSSTAISDQKPIYDFSDIDKLPPKRMLAFDPLLGDKEKPIRDIDSHSVQTLNESFSCSSLSLSEDEDFADEGGADAGGANAGGADEGHKKRKITPPKELQQLRQEVERLVSEMPEAPCLKPTKKDEVVVTLPARPPLPLFMLTSRLDSDSEHDEMIGGGVAGVAGDETDQSETTTTSTSYSDSESEYHQPSVSAVLETPAIDTSNAHKLVVQKMSKAKQEQIVQLRSQLMQVEKEMLELESRGSEKERALRRFEANTENQSLNLQLTSANLSTSVPDISLPSSDRHKSRKLSGWRSKWRKTSSFIHPPAPSTNLYTNRRSEREMSERAKGVEEAFNQSEHSRLFAELLSLISRRNQLVMREAMLVGEIKQIKLEAYQESLQAVYDDLKVVPNSNKSVGSDKKSKSTLYKRLCRPPKRTRKNQTRAYSWCNLDDDQLPGRVADVRTAVEGGQQLLSEIWRVANERNTLSAIQDETMHCARLQDMSVRKVLSRKNQSIVNLPPPTSKHIFTRPIKTP